MSHACSGNVHHEGNWFSLCSVKPPSKKESKTKAPLSGYTQKARQMFLIHFYNFHLKRAMHILCTCNWTNLVCYGQILSGTHFTLIRFAPAFGRSKKCIS